MTAGLATFERRDVVIVGGGPGGLAAAAAAAGAGASTLLVEAGSELGRPVRTSGGSWPRDLRRLGLGPELWHPVRSCELWSAARTVRFDAGEEVGCVLDVPAAWRALADRARAAGAEISTATRARWHGTAAGGARIGLKGPGLDGVAECRVAIDASGHRAVLARAAGLATAPARWGIGVEETVEAPGWPPDLIALAVGGVAPGGYGWVFPEGGGRVRAGIGVTRPGPGPSPLVLLRQWVERDPRLAALRHGSAVTRQGGTLPIVAHRPPPVGERLIAVGDAAGQASLLAGEGIRYALAGGALAGEVAAVAAAEGAGERFLRTRYARRWERDEGRMLRRAQAVYERAVALSDGEWDALLDRAARLDGADLARLVHGDLGLAFLARLAWRTRRRAPTNAAPRAGGRHTAAWREPVG